MADIRKTQRLVERIKSIPRPKVGTRGNIWDCVLLLTKALEDTLVLLDEKDQQIRDLKMDIDALDQKLETGSQI